MFKTIFFKYRALIKNFKKPGNHLVFKLSKLSISMALIGTMHKI